MACAIRFVCRPGVSAHPLLDVLRETSVGDDVVGLGRTLVGALGAGPPGLRDFPQVENARVGLPAKPGALWLLLRGVDRGELLHRRRAWVARLSPTLDVDEVLETFMYADGRDLTGYVDGTENPTDGDAVAAAVVSGVSDQLDGSTFVAVQRWQHDLDGFERRSPAQRDDIFGRRAADNEEFDSAPESAHVKRAAQESFEPEAFMVRRSMPWADTDAAGLLFIAYGSSFDAFEAVLSRMVGAEDGVVDGLFQFTRPVDGAYYWCPPVDASGKLDLRALKTK